ncbi:GerMN domain-containing protein [Treponema sp. OMZ 840]|uniref:GerMN domain-containing protein n=1 Tax=Treponema sp. OMZ 840 TaxID=244313 RepID=UPI003D93F3EE
MKDSSGKKYSGVAAAFWIVIALLILIAFLVKWDHLVSVLKETAFFEHVFGFQPEFIARHEIPLKEEKADTGKSESLILEKESAKAKQPNTEDDKRNASSDFGTSDSAAKHTEPAQNVPEASAKVPAKPAESKPPRDNSVKNTAEVKPVPLAKMNQYLCFIAISGDGFVERKEVNRAVPKTNTPLTAALNALLAGPGIPELEKGYISLIPEGTKLLSATVQNKTAFVNFSQEFAFNKYGAQGYLGQLMQVVYTATAFDTIDNVQFLIEGEKNEYLGGEGVWVGSPLARSNYYK